MASAMTDRSSFGYKKQNRKKDQKKKRLCVAIATPLGVNGRGGIDRLNDSIFENISSNPELNISVHRLVTRGQRSLFAAQFVFAHALTKFAFWAVLQKIDVLHIHLSNWGSSYRKTILGAVARLARIPYVVHLHGSNFDEFWSAAPSPLANAVGTLFLRSEQIVVLGQYWAQAIINRVPEASGKINGLPNATNLARSAQVPATGSRVRITCLGELGERKGTPQLIEALQMIASRQDWTAVIAGDGKIRETCAAWLNLGSMTGFVFRVG